MCIFLTTLTTFVLTMIAAVQYGKGVSRKMQPKEEELDKDIMEVIDEIERKESNYFRDTPSC